MVDANTNDGTFDIIQEYEHLDNFNCIRKTKRCYQTENTRDGVISAKDKTIIVTVDFDDWLPHSDVLNFLNKTYNKDIWLTYGSYLEYHLVREDPLLTNYIKPLLIKYENLFKRYSDNVIKNNTFREDNWRATHLRTFRKELFLHIKEIDFIDPETNEYFQTSGDMSFMFPMIEMCGDRFECIKEPLYVYNKSNILSDFRQVPEEQKRYGIETQTNELLDDLLASIPNVQRTRNE